MGAYLGKESTMAALAEQNRDYYNRQTWKQMFANVDIASQQAQSAVQYNFAQDVADAYDASLAQKSKIYGGNYRTGVEESLLSDIDATLEEAYAKSRETYQTNLQNVAQSKHNAQETIKSELEKQADYAIKYEQAHIDYVTDLWNKLQSGELTQDIYDSTGKLVQKGDVPSDLFTTGMFSRFTKQGAPIYDPSNDTYTYIDKNGNTQQIAAKQLTPEYIKVLESKGYTQAYHDNELMSSDEIRNMMYDETGQLTEYGRNTYDLIENYLPQYGYSSLQSYLEQTDPELANWASSYNQYDSSSGTNAGQFKELVGLNAEDVEFSVNDYINSLDDATISKILSIDVFNTDDIDDILNIANHVGLDIRGIDKQTLADDINSYNSAKNNYDIMKKDLDTDKEELKNIPKYVTKYTRGKHGETVRVKEINKKYSDKQEVITNKSRGVNMAEDKMKNAKSKLDVYSDVITQLKNKLSK